MKINAMKTKVMCISRKGEQIKIYIDAREVEQVQQFKYLSSIVTEDGYCEQDLKSRSAMAKNAFMTRRMDLQLRKRILKCTWHRKERRRGLDAKSPEKLGSV